MRKLVLYMFTTLDGFIAGRNGEFLDYEPSDEEMEFAVELFGSMDGIVFGRPTWEGFVEYWDGLDPADASVGALNQEFAAIFRRLTRIVFSHTLPDQGPNTTVMRDDIATRMTAIKQGPGRDLIMVCGPELFATLDGLGLVDEVCVLVRPVALGRGKALFGALPEPLPLTLLETRVFGSGSVMHRYRRG